MTDRPILFSGPMVRSMLDGRKTQTRRVFRGIERAGDFWHIFGNGGGIYNVSEDGVPSVAVDYVPYALGDRLWVREAWAPLYALAHSDPGVQALADRGFYRADGGTVDGEISRWRPSIHMPRWASRLTLTVTNVRVQRLQEVNEADAIAEGCYRQDAANPCKNPGIKGFFQTWQALNASRGYGWSENPWVIAVSFDVAKHNIDGAHRGIPVEAGGEAPPVYVFGARP